RPERAAGRERREAAIRDTNESDSVCTVNNRPRRRGLVRPIVGRSENPLRYQGQGQRTAGGLRRGRQIPSPDGGVEESTAGAGDWWGKRLQRHLDRHGPS